MQPYLQILGLTLPWYGTLNVLAGIAAAAVVLLRVRASAVSREDAGHLFILCIAGGFAGALALYWITRIPDVLRDLDRYLAQPALFLQVLSGGLVFYGGLLGGALAGILYARKYRVPFADACDLIIPALPLAHAIGRIGCFMGGCCYGIESPWGVVFHHSPAAPSGVTLLPIQLFESAACLCIFAFLMQLGRRARKPGWALPAYLLAYAPVRFTLEFFRGDLIRGHVLGLSTSQWISAGLLVVGISLLIFRRKSQDLLTSSPNEAIIPPES